MLNARFKFDSHLGLKTTYSYYLKRVAFPRLSGGVLAYFSLVICFWELLAVEENFGFALFVTFALYLGCLRLRLTGRPSWTRGFFYSLVAYLSLAFLLNIEISSRLAFPFGLFISAAYLGAKGGCIGLGCCGIKSIKHKDIFNWPLRPRLQTIEIFATLFSLMTLVPFAMLLSESWAGSLMIISHACIRIFAGLLRFPHKKIINFIFELSGGGIFVVGLAFFAL